jgi:erythromycin esterase-like protein
MTVHHRLALLTLLAACHPDRVIMPKAGSLSGTLTDLSGTAQPVKITVSEQDSGNEVAVIDSDSQGRFSIDVPAGEYALAVTSSTAFAYRENVKVPAHDLSVKLSADCNKIVGHVTGPVALPASVRFVRLSKFVADRFAAAVAADGSFASCLPGGKYAVLVEGAMTSLVSALTVAGPDNIRLEAYERKTIEAAPARVPQPPSTLDALVQRLKSGPRVLGLGEGNHGTGDFYTYRGQLSLELARTGDLRLVLLEADAIEMMAIDDYVNGADVDIAKAVAKLRFWITDIKEFHDFLNAVRTHNAGVAMERRVHVLGIDAQSLESPVSFLASHQAELGISEAEMALLRRIAVDHGAAFPSLSRDDNTALTLLLDRLGAPRGENGVASLVERARIAARSIRHQLGYVGNNSDVLRDAAMADIAAQIIEIAGARQTSIWGHDGHMAREADGITKSLGQYLSERFGDSYYPIAFLSYEGSSRAWDAKSAIGVISHELRPTDASNLESVIMSATGFPDVAWVDLETSNAPLKSWLALPRYVREFGSSYVPGHTQTLRKFPQAFRAVVVIKHATSSTPTPTGERRAKP